MKTLNFSEHQRVHFIGDLCFGHQPISRQNISGLNGTELNEEMIKVWNERVCYNDIVIVMGSLIKLPKNPNQPTGRDSIVGYHSLNFLLEKLNGRIILLAEANNYDFYRNILLLSNMHFENYNMGNRIDLHYIKPDHFDFNIYTKDAMYHIGISGSSKSIELYSGNFYDRVRSEFSINISVDSMNNDGYGPTLLDPAVRGMIMDKI